MSATEVLNQLHDSFKEHKEANDQRWKEIQARLDEIEAGRNRQSFSGIATDRRTTPEQAQHKKMFLNGFARKGNEAGLLDLEIQAGMRTGSDPDGGFMVPDELDRTIENLVKDQSPMRRICNVISIGTPNYTKLVNKGGATSGWVGEEQERPETDTPQLAALTPYLGEIYANPAATQTQLDDAGFDVESFITDNVAEEFATQEGTAFISGNGILKPKGLLSYDTSTDPDATRAFGTLQYVKTGDAAGFKAASATVSPADCLTTLLYSVRRPYRNGAVWLLNSNTLSVISKFKDAVNGLPIWRDSLAAGQPSTLLGYPVEEDENMPDIAAGAFPIAFGNFKRGFYIVDRMGIRMLRDPFTRKPWVHFYTTKRVGTFLNNSQAIKLLKIGA